MIMVWGVMAGLFLGFSKFTFSLLYSGLGVLGILTNSQNIQNSKESNQCDAKMFCII
jgi:hypothetical protein